MCLMALLWCKKPVFQRFVIFQIMEAIPPVAVKASSGWKRKGILAFWGCFSGEPCTRPWCQPFSPGPCSRLPRPGAFGRASSSSLSGAVASSQAPLRSAGPLELRRAAAPTLRVGGGHGAARGGRIGVRGGERWRKRCFFFVVR